MGLRAGDEEYGDVVAAAVVVSGVDESLTGGIESRARGAGQDFGDVGVIEFAGEAVGREEEDIAGLGGMGGDLGLDGRARADGARDDVTDGGAIGLLATEQACADLLLDQRVILREKLQGAATEEIAAAVTDVGEPERRCVGGCFPEGCDESSGHAAHGARFLGALEDAVVGGADGALKAGVRMIFRVRVCGVLSGRWRGEFRALAEAVEEGFGREMAGDFTGCCASYSVANDEGALFGQCGACILIGVAHESGMGKHGEDAREVNRGVRLKGGGELWLEGLYSRSVCHFGTRDARIRDR